MRNEQDIDLNTLNEVDLECNYSDDDDSFGELKVEVPVKPSARIMADNEEDGAFHEALATNSGEVKKTGIMIDLSEDDDIPSKKIVSTIDDPDYMEANITDDDEKELIPDEFIEETFSNDIAKAGKVSGDYWKKLSKTHAKTNKKGAYNTHFHFAGNPEKERQMFNHEMGSDKGLASVSSDGAIAGASAAGGEGGGGEGGGMGESLATKSVESELNDVFKAIGFDVIKNSNDSYIAFDTCEQSEDIEAKDIKDLLSQLSPYIDMCIIFPLEAASNKKFDSCKEWVDWYDTCDNANIKKRCADNIKLCKVLNKY